MIALNDKTVASLWLSRHRLLLNKNYNWNKPFDLYRDVPVMDGNLC